MRYLSQRIAFYFLAFFVAVTINFFLPRMMPGNPVDAYLANKYANSGGVISEEMIKSVEELFGFTYDAPLGVQYVEYVKNIFTGNWGLSIKYYPLPVTKALGRGLKWTAFLVGSAIIISTIINFLLGILVAWRRGSAFDSIVTLTGLLFGTIPAIVFALLLFFLFVTTLKILPGAYAYDSMLIPGFNLKFISSVLYHAILPVTSIVLLSLGGIMGTRANMINQLGEDYIVMGWAKGVPDKVVMFGYGARNSLLPMVTSLAMSLGYLFGGSLITEIVFNYPGIGLVMFQGLSARDYPLIQGQLLITTIMVIVFNLIADVLVFALDPRLKKSTQ